MQAEGVAAIARSNAWTVLATAMSMALGISCAEAGGEVSGGERRFDATAPNLPLGDDAGTSETIACAPADRATGHTFTDLYKDYFGHVGGPACSGDGACHGAPEQEGASVSGYVCPAGNRDACYQGLRSSGLVLAADRDIPENSRLYSVLRKVNGAGFMPLRPQCAFDDVDIARITAWIRGGAPND